MNIDNQVSEYYKKDSKLIEYIQKIVDEKNALGEWDKGVEGQSQNLVTMLLYEYSTSIENLTEGKITSKQVIDKLEKNMGKLRIGDFKKGNDDNIYYDANSVTSNEYKKQCRIDSKFGAHALTYKDDKKEEKSAIVLFDNEQKSIINGKEQEVSGIDLQDLSDIRGTIFHEWTHVMERCKVKSSKLTKGDLVYKNGDSTYINAMLSPNLSTEQFNKFIANVDRILKSDIEIPFGGISTIEINPSKSDKRIMHNQISEGATEYIARKVMENVGDKVKHPERYAGQVKIVGNIFERKGLSKMLTMYFEEPQKMIRDAEQKEVKGKDMLHYISDYVNVGHHSLLGRLKIDKEGNVKVNPISKFIKSVKIKFNKKEIKTLPEGQENKFIGNSDEQQQFLKSIRVSPEYLKARTLEKNNYENVIQVKGKNDEREK